MTTSSSVRKNAHFCDTDSHNCTFAEQESPTEIDSGYTALDKNELREDT